MSCDLEHVIGGLNVLVAAPAEIADVMMGAAGACEDVAGIDVVHGVPAALALLSQTNCDVIVLQVRSKAGDAREEIAAIRQQWPELAVVAIDDGSSTAELRTLEQDGCVHGVLRTRGLDAEILGLTVRYAASRVRMEHNMLQREEALRALFDLNPHAMWVYDARTLKFLAVNQMAVRMYGYSEGEFLSMRITDLRSPQEAERLRQHIARGLPRFQSAGIWKHLTKYGQEIDVAIDAQAIPLWGPSARLIQARDVTAERRAMRAVEASEKRFRSLFENSTGFICTHDLDGVLLSINPAAANAIGRSVAELLGRNLRDLCAPQRPGRIEEYLEDIARKGYSAGLMTLHGPGNSELVWQYRNLRYVDADGTVYVMGYAQDVTALRSAEGALRRSERRLLTIADALPLKIAYIDGSQHYVFANEAYRAFYAPEGEEIVGRHMRDVIGKRRYGQRQPFIEHTLHGERTVFEAEEGEGEAYRCYEFTYIPELDEAGTGILGMHVMIQDVTAKKREEKRLIHLTQVDSLTGLVNRAGFHLRLESAIARALDQHGLLAIFYIDIDHFKHVNDTYGHATGDALIKAFADRLAGKVRASDVLARMGGDEFTIFIEAAHGEEHLRVIADKLMASIRRPFELLGRAQRLTITASIGVALWQGRGAATADSLINCADTMLYRAKQDGRDTYRLISYDDWADMPVMRHGS